MASSVPDWPINSRYELLQLLGTGTYGRVCEAIDKHSRERVAIKQVRAIFEDQVIAKHLLREISILKRLNHPNIVQIFHILVPCDRPQFENVYLVMEYAETDLRKMSKSESFLSPMQVKVLLYQAICGCRYMHSASVLHRDLKPANILINTNCSLRICDFGLSRSYRLLNQFQDQINSLHQDSRVPPNPSSDFVHMNQRTLTEHVVTRFYRAPEVILCEKQYGKAMDIWSLGCVFGELLQMIEDNCPDYLERTPLFPGASCFPLSPDMSGTHIRAGYPVADSDQLNMIFKVIGTPHEDDLDFITDPQAYSYVQSYESMPPVNFHSLFPAATEDELDLLSRLLTFSPRKRITLDEALEHPYFQGIRRPELEILAESQVDFVFDNSDTMNPDALRSLFLLELER